MSLKRLRTLLEMLPLCTNWTLNLLHFQEDKKNDAMAYQCRPIELYPAVQSTELLNDISNEYLKSPSKRLDKYRCVEPYSGDIVGTTIYVLGITDPLVRDSYDRLLTSLAYPDEVTNAVQFKTNAYLWQGAWEIQNQSIPIKLITIQDPFKTLKHKFFYEDGVFSKAKTKVLDIRLYVDVIGIGDKLYFMNMAGERLFGIERAYRVKSQKIADQLTKCPYFLNGENLKRIALSGHYPRLLLNYQPQNLQYLSTTIGRTHIAKKFHIAQTPGGELDMNRSEDADRLLRFLCNKAMLNPVDESPMEVAAAKQWN